MMKRGFLNTEKAKRTLDRAADSPKADATTSIKKDPEIIATTSTDESNIHTPRLDLHSIPQSVKDSMGYPADRNRFVFRQWPRDPNGKPIVPSDIHGKEAGNGLNLWGATLYDFYFVRRLPNNVHALTISTGSKLKKVMEAFGELEHAKNELAWAEREEDPKEILPWDPAEAIEAYERRLLMQTEASVEKGNEEKPQDTSSSSETCDITTDVDMVDASEPLIRASGSGSDTGESAEDSALDDHHIEPAKTSAMEGDSVESQQTSEDSSSPFDPRHYPSPWPFAPFEAPHPPFNLQRGIPIHLLPKKLHVHDPWNLVRADEEVPKANESWSSKTDNVLTYTLSFSPETQKVVEEAAKAAAAAEDEALKQNKTVLFPPQPFAGPTTQPGIRAILPSRPRKLTEVPEAHLYLSPKGALGLGNHSTVHTAEWELPRDLFCESTICDDCLKDQVKLEIVRLRESGEWSQRLEEAIEEYERTKGECADTSPSLVASDMKNTSTEIEADSSTSPQTRVLGVVRVKIEYQPRETIEMVASSQPGEAPAADAPSQYFAQVSDQVIHRIFEYDGPVITIHPNVKWQNPSFPETICTHQAQNKKPVPRTATFRVAAKLSIPDDPHLAREAQNYLKFPAHFFQHWNGYNVIPPLHDPTPVGALVPQFFGYYTPDFQPEGQYRSPILLIEHCGQPIRVNELSMDDRHECAALLFRFHAAGWMHESFAERNILMQRGQPTRSPLEEHKGDRLYSFRLIDFGRSREYEHAQASMVEESMGRKLFCLL